MALEFIAVVCSALFAGAAVYISVVQQPAADALGTATAVAYFRPMYAKAAPLQASLALIGSAAAIGSWGTGSGGAWLLGAAFLAFVLPFTLIVIKPTNDRLKDPALDPSSDDAARLLARWSRLHAVRSLAGILSFLVFVWALAGL